MKIFLTGATGFIGKHLVQKLLNEGFDITINMREKGTSPFDKGVKIYYLGENNTDDDISYLKAKSFDGVVHLASLYLTNHKSNEVNDLVDSNVKFGTYLLECAVKANIKWFINTGTFWQYYKNAAYSPVNLYAATKQAFEIIAQYYIETNQITFTTIKLSDTFGPNDTRPKVFNLWEKIANNGETLDMSPGEQIIDICYIDDVVGAFSLLVKHLQGGNKKIQNGAVFAVRAKNRFTLKHLAGLFEKVTGKQLKINWGAKGYRDREVMVPWEDGTTVPDWQQLTSLEEGIRATFK